MQTDLGLVEGLDELGGSGGLLAAALDEDELDLGQHLGLPDVHGYAMGRQEQDRQGSCGVRQVQQQHGLTDDT